jgi:hypothetical protein
LIAVDFFYLLDVRYKCNLYILGIKRKRWSPEEIEALKQAFGEQISNKQNVPTEEIRNAKKRFKILNDRSEAMIRTKINNIKLGKEKFH